MTTPPPSPPTAGADRSRRRAATLLLVPLMLLAACERQAIDADGAAARADGGAELTQAPPQPAGGEPQIFFRAPRADAEVPATFEVVFGLRNFGVAPAGVNLSRTGHFHVLVNVPAPAAGEIIPTDSAHRHFGAGQIETMLTLAPGEHQLRLVLADHEHRVIAGLVSEPLRVMVRPAP